MPNAARENRAASHEAALIFSGKGAQCICSSVMVLILGRCAIFM